MKELKKISNRLFYKTILQITVLSEEPIPPDMKIGEIAYEADEGTYSMATTDQAEIPLNGKEMADALEDQGSEPGFFGLDEDGNDRVV